MRHRESETVSQSQILLAQVARYRVGGVRMGESIETPESGTHCNGGGKMGGRQFVAEM